MPDLMPPYWLIRIAVAGVWLYEGLWCKLLRGEPREFEVVKAVPRFGERLQDRRIQNRAFVFRMTAAMEDYHNKNKITHSIVSLVPTKQRRLTYGACGCALRNDVVIWIPKPT